jgi:DHA1 family multidrug resistance protein-like MFS transporter
VGLITQTLLVQRFSKWLGVKRAFTVSIVFTALAMLIMPLFNSITIFVFAMVILGLFNSIVQTLIPAILSQEADAKSQGSIMGLNASYQSMGMIIGPILGGLLATIAIPLPFIVGALLVALCFFLSFKVMQKGMKKDSAF